MSLRPSASDVQRRQRKLRRLPLTTARACTVRAVFVTSLITESPGRMKGVPHV
jgi:hypothetical protein